MLNVFLRDVEDPEYKPAPALFKDDMEVTHFHFIIPSFLYSLGKCVWIWMGRSRLRLNPSKTEWLWVCRLSDSKETPNLILDGVMPLQYSELGYISYWIHNSYLSGYYG